MKKVFGDSDCLKSFDGNAPYRAYIRTNGPHTRPHHPRPRHPRAKTVSSPAPPPRLSSRPCSICLPLPLSRSVPSTSSTPATSAPFCGFEARTGVELHVDKPLFVQATSRCYAESACCNSMFQMFQIFSMYIAIVRI